VEIHYTPQPDIANFIDESVKSGNFTSASIVMDEALNLLRGTETKRLHAEIQKGIDDYENGRYSTWNPDEILNRIKKLNGQID